MEESKKFTTKYDDIEKSTITKVDAKTNKTVEITSIIDAKIDPTIKSSTKVLENQDYSHLDFYCSHGSVDQVIPVDWARRTPPFLSNLHIKHQYSEFPVGHGVAPQNFYELKDWLSKRIT